MSDLIDGVGCVSREDDLVGVASVQKGRKFCPSVGDVFRHGGSVSVDGAATAPGHLRVVSVNGIHNGLGFERDAGVVEIGRWMVPSQGREIFAVFTEHSTRLPDRACSRGRVR